MKRCFIIILLYFQCKICRNIIEKAENLNFINGFEKGKRLKNINDSIKSYITNNIIYIDINSSIDEALKNKYDLVILDIMLPKYSGFEIIKYIEDSKNLLSSFILPLFYFKFNIFYLE